MSLWQNNLVAIRVEAEFGVLVNDPEAFVKLTGGVAVPLKKDEAPKAAAAPKTAAK